MKKLFTILFFMIACPLSFAADEIHVDYESSATLYAARFQPAGNVFVTNGSSDEAWSTAGDYDVTMTENGSGGHFVGSFDAATNIGDGTFKITVYEQLGGAPADSDRAIYVGEIKWKDGTEDRKAAESDHDTTDALITISHSTTDGLITTVDGVVDSILTLAQWAQDWMEADTWTNIETTPWREEIRTKGTESVLTEKELYQVDGEDVTAVYHRIGQKTEP